MRCFIFVLLLSLFSLPACAWNAAGHRIVALIAWQQLTPATRAVITALLAQHPDYRRWIAHTSSESTAQQAFLEASTWPDDIRNDPRFDDDGQMPAPPGFPDSNRRRQWHYVDLADTTGAATTYGELDRQLDRLALQLADPGASRSAKAYALPWLIHLLGDIHQPLHVGRHQDSGGNQHEIEDPDNPRLPSSNLHRWWDDRPGPPWLRGKYLERSVARLLQRYPEPPLQGNIALWRQESWQLTRTRAYPPSPRISAEFQQQAQAISERRLVEAGWRLGRWLNQLLPTVPRETSSE